MAERRYKEEMKEEMKEEKAKCVHCGYGAKDGEDLDDHLESAHRGSLNRRARTCIACPPPNNVFADLERHFSQVHGLERSEGARCGCGQVFRTRRLRNIHARECQRSGIQT